MSKAYTVTKEINGVKYTAQFVGPSVSLKLADETHLDSNPQVQSLEKTVAFLFKNVISEPSGLTVDSFDKLSDVTDVTDFATKVMNGEIRPETDKK